MPAKLERCVEKVKKRNRKKGTKKVNAWAVCQKSTGQKPHRRKKR